MLVRKLDDFHVHVRQRGILSSVLPYSMSQCARALLMPNTVPAITTPEILEAYQREVALNVNGAMFEPLFTFKITPQVKVSDVLVMKAMGAVAGKAYPCGVTTNSNDGISNWCDVEPILEVMEKLDLVLCLHGEHPGDFSSANREYAFVEIILPRLIKDFPRLRIVLEHISDKYSVQVVREAPDTVAATITLHHLMCTVDDVIGDKLNPSCFCKPIPKTKDDQSALVMAACSGNPKFFFGSDSAPHLIANKYCEAGAAGVYSAPVMLPALFEFFIDQFPNYGPDYFDLFATKNGAKFYRLPQHDQTVELIEDPWIVPNNCDGITPFLNGKTLKYQLQGGR